MSYPPYQQGAGNQAPYPQQQAGGGYPGPNCPYPQQSGVFPPSLGMPVNAPMYMPQPYGPPGQYPQMPAYAPPGGGYAPPTPGYAPPTAAYAPPAGGVPVYPTTTDYPSSHNPPPNMYGPPPTSGGGGHYHQHDQHHHNVVAPPQKKYTPTLRPANPFNPREDAEVLRKAMKGFGTDEKAIINVLGRRTNAQRLEIAVQFKTLYGKDLIKDLKSELSGKLEDLVVALMTPLPQFYANELHHAMSGIGTVEETLIEIMCSLTNNEIRIICAAYQTAYHRALEEDLRGDTSGSFKRLMTSLCTAGRDESPHVDQAAASADAQALLRAGELRLGTDESTFNMILCQRSYAQLALIFEEYKRLTGNDIEKAIKHEFSGDIEDGLKAIIRCVRNRPLFYAKRIQESMKGMGTHDRQLIRLIATRCEVDMEDIKTNYQAEYGKSMKDAIADDTSGDYKKLLLCLIGDY